MIFVQFEIIARRRLLHMVTTVSFILFCCGVASLSEIPGTSGFIS